jgi:PIN domain nuclease of toxin-antitoxin system
MRYLLDTHVILWWLMAPNEIKSKARKVIQDKANTIFLSSASFWEMAIKKSLGRLTLPQNFLNVLAAERFELLPIMPEECLGVADLPLLHTDPFDRLLVMQAKLHQLVVITRDSKIADYSVVTLNA